MIRDWNDLPLLLTVKLAAAVTGYGPFRIRELCRAGRLPHIRLGRAYMIPRDTLRVWLEAQAAASVRDPDFRPITPTWSRYPGRFNAPHGENYWRSDS